MLARNKPSKDIIDAFKVLLNNECVELDLTSFNNDGQTVTDIALDKGDLISECTLFSLWSHSQKSVRNHFPSSFHSWLKSGGTVISHMYCSYIGSKLEKTL